MSSQLGYLQSRVQARYALLPDYNLWLHLSALNQQASFLEEARGTVLAKWIAGFSANSSAEEIETNIQQQLIDTINETAGWFEPSWSPAVYWITTLLELPALLSTDADQTPADSRFKQQGLHKLLLVSTPEVDVLQLWLSAWRDLMPQMSNQDKDSIDRLVKILQGHWRHFADTPVKDAWKARQQLENRLRYFFRSHVMQPAMAFAYLALVALLLERLRAELLHRALFARQALDAQPQMVNSA